MKSIRKNRNNLSCLLISLMFTTPTCALLIEKDYEIDSKFYFISGAYSMILGLCLMILVAMYMDKIKKTTYCAAILYLGIVCSFFNINKDPENANLGYVCLYFFCSIVLVAMAIKLSVRLCKLGYSKFN